MTKRSALDPSFLQAVERQLSAGEILVVVRYAYGGGARDYLFFKEMSEFRLLLDSLSQRDSVVLMKSFRKLVEGRVGAALIDAAEAAYPDGACWIVLDKDPPKYQARNFPAECRGDLVEELREMMGRDVCIIEEPKYASEEHSIGAYIPDEDGSVRPAAY